MKQGITVYCILHVERWNYNYFFFHSQLDAAAKLLSGPKVQTIVTISKTAEATTTVVTHSQAAQLGEKLDITMLKLYFFISILF